MHQIAYAKGKGTLIKSTAPNLLCRPFLGEIGRGADRTSMSASGTWRTSMICERMSAFGGKAHMAIALQMSAYDP